MAEVPSGEYGGHFQRSIDQLRSMNERGVFGPLGGLTANDIRTTLVHEFKPFISDLRNPERLDYSKTNLDLRGLAQQTGGVITGVTGQTSTNEHTSTNSNNNNTSNNNNNNNLVNNHKNYSNNSAPATPSTPSSEGPMTDTKVSQKKKLYERHKGRRI